MYNDVEQKSGHAKVLNELPLETFKLLVCGKKHELVGDNTKMIIVKFGATWCRPCQQIKSLCEKMFEEMPDNVSCFDIDIDESMDLYISLKKYKMANGVPCLLAYVLNPNRNANEWYIPNNSVTGGNPVHVVSFFDRCKQLAMKL